MAFKTVVSVKGMQDLQLSLERLKDGNYRRAVRRGINSSLEIIQQAEKKQAETDFENPTPFTISSFRLKYASTSNLEGKVYFQDPKRLSENQHYLYHNVHGIARGYKKFEAALLAKGLMPPKHYAIPGKSVNLDRYGNISSALIVQILNFFDANSSGYAQGTKPTRKEKLKSGTRKKYGFEYFALLKKTGNKRPGIYKKTFTGFGTAIESVLIFIPSNQVHYSNKFKFYERAKNEIEKNFKTVFDRELKNILSETIL
jgi:hypothetical protein